MSTTVESVYDMASLRDTRHRNGVFPAGNVHIIVDETHTTRIFGPRDRRVVALFGLEDHVLVGLHVWQSASGVWWWVCSRCTRRCDDEPDGGPTAVTLMNTFSCLIMPAY